MIAQISRGLRRSLHQSNILSRTSRTTSSFLLLVPPQSAPVSSSKFHIFHHRHLATKIQAAKSQPPSPPSPPPPLPPLPATTSKSDDVTTASSPTTPPITIRSKLISTLQGIRSFIYLYWNSLTSFVQEIQLAVRLSHRIYLKGHRYTRSERKKMQRAAVDVMKVLPFFSMTLVVGTEITALLAARAVPSMLPGAFQPVAKKVDENLPKFVDNVLPSGKDQRVARNKTRVEIADKLHELSLQYAVRLNELKEETRDINGVVDPIKLAKVEKDAYAIAQFLFKADDPESRITPEDIAAVGPSFRRHMQLQQLSRIQLIRMAQYMNQGSEILNLMMPTFVLVRRLRMRIQSARADDKDIHFEGVASLDDIDLKDACYERGLSRSKGSESSESSESGGESSGASSGEDIDTLTLQSRLRNWISLSINREVPSSLLILSSALISRRQLKLEQEHGASALQAATIQHRISELDFKIARRTKERDDAQHQLDEILHVRLSREERRKARRVGSEVKEETKSKGELDMTHVQPGCEEILIHGDQEVDQENNNQKEETLKRRADAIIQIQNLLKTSETTDTGTCR